jgi:beta-glucosidase
MADQFLFGASISGHQVDDGANDQWTPWEERNAIRLAAEAERRHRHLPNWEKIRAAATSPANYRSGKGIEHRQHFRQDLKMLKGMGLNSLRFSIEWSALEPREGEWDDSAFAYYDEYFDQLERLGIEPLVTLWHWTHPAWFEYKGGFASKDYLYYFTRYVRKVMLRYGSRIKWLIILNEPNTYTGKSFVQGAWPPGGRSPYRARKVYHHLARAHRHAYRITKAIRPDMMIGTSALLANVQPKRPEHAIDNLIAHWERLWWNWWFLEQVRWQIDFIGVNYYFTDYIKNFRRDNPSEPRSDMGWYMEPGGIEHVLSRVRLHFRQPIIITETGLADAGDKWRQWWIDETIAGVQRAEARGIDVRGYFYWSLLDNFEWSDGWWPKFGLISVDRDKPGMPRRVRESAKALAKHKRWHS